MTAMTSRTNHAVFRRRNTGGRSLGMQSMTCARAWAHGGINETWTLESRSGEFANGLSKQRPARVKTNARAGRRRNGR